MTARAVVLLGTLLVLLLMATADIVGVWLSRRRMRRELARTVEVVSFRENYAAAARYYGGGGKPGGGK